MGDSYIRRFVDSFFIGFAGAGSSPENSACLGYVIRLPLPLHHQQVDEIAPVDSRGFCQRVVQQILVVFAGGRGGRIDELACGGRRDDSRRSASVGSL
jgi:hypothetical protein